MAIYDRHFTLEEARSWLPELRQRFQRVHALYEELQDLREDFARAQQLVRSNGHNPKETGFEGRLGELQETLRGIVEAGIEVKDITRGLVDFPHLRQGEEVFLCWELGEDDIRYWHRIEDGYAGREPL